MEQPVGEIYRLLGSVNNKLSAIGKTKKNTTQNYFFRGIDDVYNALNPLFKESGIITVPEVLESIRECKDTKAGGSINYTILKVKYTFYAPDGSNISSVVQGEGMDSADKSSNKALAAAHKYALMQIFCIPTENMVDADYDTPTDTKPSFDEKSLAEWCASKKLFLERKNGMLVISGKTYDHRDALKRYGFQYDSANKNYAMAV